ncbi:hypothetical protein E8E14_013848 [Neopestalotiopsis sp. 37M]|nr:hypothetical protein E8E14_013848 [Neopestalotiopsis sp. 37M]
MSPKEDPLSTFVFADYQRDLSVNLHSAVVAAQEAVRGFSRLPEASSKTFIYTGNKLNVMSDPKVFSFGIARTGAAHFIWDCSIAYRHKGFYYTDERLEDGSPSRGLMDPTAQAVLYHQLCEDMDQGPWLYTFVKDHGYKSFQESDQPWSVS